MKKSEREISLMNFVPNKWFLDKDNSSVVLSAYHALRVSKDDMPTGFKIIDLDDVLVIIISIEGLPYLTMDELKIITHPNGNYTFNGN